MTSNNKNFEQVVGNGSTTSEKMPLTFKEWKILKDSANKKAAKTRTTEKNFRRNRNDKNIVGTSWDKRNNSNYNTYNASTISNGRGALNLCAGSNVFTGSKQSNHFSEMNSFRSLNNGINNLNFSNVSKRFISYAPECFKSSSALINRIVNANRLNYSNEYNNLDLPTSFFSSDGIYRQKDVMQKPLLNNHFRNDGIYHQKDIMQKPNNQFRNETKDAQMLRDYDKSRNTKFGKKNIVNKKHAEGFVNNEIHRFSKSTRPKVNGPNPKSKNGEKQFVPKPKIPEENLEITKDEKKQQWKEYREAMKPFKNREFYNAKRVVQRLAKKDLSELDEKQLIRLANARELMAAHKSRLSEKYTNYIKADNNSGEPGELYVLRKKSRNDPELLKPTNSQYHNNGNFGVSS